jgi:hypothetical protein
MFYEDIQIRIRYHLVHIQIMCSFRASPKVSKPTPILDFFSNMKKKNLHQILISTPNLYTLRDIDPSVEIYVSLSNRPIRRLKDMREE